MKWHKPKHVEHKYAAKGKERRKFLEILKKVDCKSFDTTKEGKMQTFLSSLGKTQKQEAIL